MTINELSFFEERTAYYARARKSMLSGWKLNLDLPDVVRLDTRAHALATRIVGESKVRPHTRPTTPAGIKRWHKSYTDRGLKVT